MLKKIEGYIEPSRLDGLVRALAEAVEGRAAGISVSEARGIGRRLGGEGEAKLLERMKIEIVVDEGLVDRVVQLIIDAAQAGAIGGGKVFVLPVEDAVRVGAGEVGSADLH